MAMYAQNHIQISVELLQLLQWMSEHEHEALKQIMGRALLHTTSPIEALANPSLTSEEGVKDHVLQFFGILEGLLYETREEATATQQLQRFLVPSVNRIDSSQCDVETISRSAEKAKTAMETGSASNSKEALCRSLIKQWHPQVSKQERH